MGILWAPAWTPVPVGSMAKIKLLMTPVSSVMKGEKIPFFSVALPLLFPKIYKVLVTSQMAIAYCLFKA